MTVDCGKNGPAKYRTETDDNLNQTCYFGKKKDRIFNKLTATNLNPSSCDNLTFTIETTIKNSTKEQHLTYNLLIKNNEDSQDENTDK